MMLTAARLGFQTFSFFFFSPEPEKKKLPHIQSEFYVAFIKVKSLHKAFLSFNLISLGERWFCRRLVHGRGVTKMAANATEKCSEDSNFLCSFNLKKIKSVLIIES